MFITPTMNQLIPESPPPPPIQCPLKLGQRTVRFTCCFSSKLLYFFLPHLARCGTSAVESLFLKKTPRPMRVIEDFVFFYWPLDALKNTLSRPDSAVISCFGTCLQTQILKDVCGGIAFFVCVLVRHVFTPNQQLSRHSALICHYI